MQKILKITSMQCLQYRKNELSYEVDVLHVDKHEGFLKVDSIFFQ